MKVAIIGCGVMGRYHARTYKQFKDVDLVAVCDINQKAAKDLADFYNTKYFTNFRDLIKKMSLDAVSITVPTKLHHQVALAFINSGISVLVEKPLAENVKQARDIANLAKQNKVTLLTGHIERFNPAVEKLQQLLNNGEFGDILSIVVKRVGLFPSRIQDTDVVTDLAVHDLDIITNIVGKLPNSVFARGGGGLTDNRIDYAEIYLNFGNFASFLEVNWVTPVKIRNLSITGTKGYGELNYISQKLDLYRTNYIMKKSDKFSQFVVKSGKVSKQQVPITRVEPLKLEIENFINSVKGFNKPKVSGEDGVRAVMLAEAVKKSIKSGKLVRI